MPHGQKRLLCCSCCGLGSLEHVAGAQYNPLKETDQGGGDEDSLVSSFQASEIGFFPDLPQLQSASLCPAGIWRITGRGQVLEGADSASGREAGPRETLTGSSAVFLA